MSDSNHLDVRYAIGALFATLGLILAAYGLLGPAEGPTAFVPMNIDLWWGVVMLIFGALLLTLARRATPAMIDRANSKFKED